MPRKSRRRFYWASLPDEELLQFALELFQWDNKLGVDGEAGPDSRQELKDTHGC